MGKYKFDFDSFTGTSGTDRRLRNLETRLAAIEADLKWIKDTLLRIELETAPRVVKNGP